MSQPRKSSNLNSYLPLYVCVYMWCIKTQQLECTSSCVYYVCEIAATQFVQQQLISKNKIPS